VTMCGVLLRSTHDCLGEEFINGVMRWRYNVVTITNVVLQLLPAESLVRIMSLFPKIQRVLRRQTMAVSMRAALMLHVLLVHVRLHVMLRSLGNPGLELYDRFVRFKQIYTGETKCLDMSGSTGQLAVIKWRYVTESNGILILDHTCSELRKNFPEHFLRMVNCVQTLQRRWRNRTIASTITKTKILVHYTALHELLKRNNCVKYWPLFLKESITIHNLGDLSPGELKQCTNMPMGVAVDLLKAFHAEQNAQTLGSELFPSVHTTLSKPPPPTPAPPGQPMHHAAGGGGSGRRSRGASPRAAPVVMRPQHSPQQQQRKAQWTDNPYELVMPAAEAESESRPAAADAQWDVRNRAGGHQLNHPHSGVRRVPWAGGEPQDHVGRADAQRSTSLHIPGDYPSASASAGRAASPIRPPRSTAWVGRRVSLSEVPDELSP
jgi:hypothetical protein